MKMFLTHNDQHIDVNGTCLVGHITAHYSELVDVFGNPTEGDGYKVDAEWKIEFEDGTVGTIYNWKNGPNYCGEHGKLPEFNTDWNVGGKGYDSWSFIDEVLINHRQINNKVNS
jgi:hypothetical protein